MSPATDPSPLPYRFGLAEIALSTLAILALASLIFVVLAFAGTLAISIAALGIIGVDAFEAFASTVRDKSFLQNGLAMELAFQLIGLTTYAALGAAVAVIAHLPKRMPLEQRVAFFDWTLDRNFWLVLLATVLYSLVAGHFLELARPETSDLLALPKSPVALFIAFVTNVCLRPFCEELLFRGWIYTGLRTRFSFGVTLWVTSAVFALMHFDPSLLVATVIFPVGLALGYVRERYGSIKASACFHIACNLFDFVADYFGIG